MLRIGTFIQMLVDISCSLVRNSNNKFFCNTMGTHLKNGRNSRNRPFEIRKSQFFLYIVL